MAPFSFFMSHCVGALSEKQIGCCVLFHEHVFMYFVSWLAQHSTFSPGFASRSEQGSMRGLPLALISPLQPSHVDHPVPHGPSWSLPDPHISICPFFPFQAFCHLVTSHALISLIPVPSTSPIRTAPEVLNNACVWVFQRSCMNSE